jgi:hypothetical protein
VFRADFLGFQMRYKVLKMGPSTSGELQRFGDSLILFVRVRSLSMGLCQSLSRGFEVRLWVPNSKHNPANLLLIVHCAAMILFMLCPKKDDG